MQELNHQPTLPSVQALELDPLGAVQRALGLKLWTVGPCAESGSEPRPPDKIDLRSDTARIKGLA